MMKIKNKKIIQNKKVINTFTGALMGYFIFHPLAHVLNVLLMEKSIKMMNIGFKDIFSWIIESFSLDMFFMGLLYIIVFGIYGFIIGLQKEKIELQNHQIIDENILNEKMRRENERFMRHELKNLFFPIRGYADLLSFTAHEKLDDKEKSFIEGIITSIDKASNLIDNLKNLHDIEIGNYNLEKKVYSLNKILNMVISELKPLAQKNSVIINFITNDINHDIYADLNLMPGVFTNLILNAIEHVSDLENDNEKIIIISLEKNTNYLFVKINNKGVPIPPEKLSTFFEKFNSDRNKKGGMGLGTTYAYLVIKAHGGEILVNSNQIEGTTLKVKLPKYVSLKR